MFVLYGRIQRGQIHRSPYQPATCQAAGGHHGYQMKRHKNILRVVGKEEKDEEGQRVCRPVQSAWWGSIRVKKRVGEVKV